MEDFETARFGAVGKEGTAEIIPMPPPKPKPAPLFRGVEKPITDIPQTVQVSSLKAVMKSIPSLVSNSRSMRIASTPILRSSTAGKTDFPLDSRSDLRRAILANVIFGPPRVYDTSFDNTIM
jgi:hypothetical protein